MIKVLLICICVLANSSMTFAAKLDCKKDLNSESLVVIVDLSDRLDVPSTFAFKSLAGKIAKISPPGGMLYVYDLNKISADIGDAELAICVPSFTSLTGDKLKQRKEKEFLNSVVGVFDRLAVSNNESLTTSPIIEGIYKVGFQVFNKDGISNAGRIVVISDFEQNTNLISFYKSGVPDYKDWKGHPDAKAWMLVMPKVKFTSVLIQRAQNNTRVNHTKLRSFWLDYSGNNFEKCGFMGLNQAAVELKNECN